MSDERILIPDCKERVAFDLMKTIAVNDKNQANDRTYWTELYSHCLAVVNGALIK